MEPWHTVQNQTDIDALLTDFSGFHDSCLVRAEYRSGCYVDETNAMRMSGPGGYRLRLAFHIAGWQERYSCDILDCYLAIHTDLVPGRDDPIVVWADGDCFDPKNIPAQGLLEEGGYSYAAARGLQWRWYTEGMEETP